MTKVWVTRTEPGAIKTAAALDALGYKAVAAPLLTIGPPPAPATPLPYEAVLIITSQNALRALSASTEERHWPVICVGDATAELALKLGFDIIHSADGTSADIVPLVQSLFNQTPRPFIHLSGDVVRGQITQDLTAQGYRAERRIIYASHSVTQMPDLSLSEISHVLLFSPKAAACLAQLAPDMRHAAAISISRETDAALGGVEFAARRFAARPNEASMLRMLD